MNEELNTAEVNQLRTYISNLTDEGLQKAITLIAEELEKRNS
jgi:hypothetical protein